MPSIAEGSQRIKVWLDDALSEWGILAIVLLVGMASFGLGRLSALEEAKPAVSIRQAAAAATPQALYTGGLLVASRSGAVYYYPWCAGGAKITPANQIWFASEEEGRRAGYAPAKNCKGLVQ